MKTQISVLVKGEGMLSKQQGNPFLGPFAILKKSKAILVLDGKEHELVESKEPYVFDVEPGEHQIRFLDPNKAMKDIGNSMGKAMYAGMGLLVGGAVGASAGSDIADLLFSGEIEGGAADVLLREGDILKLSCKGTMKGVPKVKVLK